MPTPIDLEIYAPTIAGPDGSQNQVPPTYYVLYDDGSIRSYMREDPRRGGTGEWRDLAPPDDHAQD